MILRALIVVISLVGLWNAFYFTFAYYGRVKRARWVPAILCAREGSNCVTVVQTPYARVFGVPNSLLGIIYYLAVLAFALGGIWLKAERAGLWNVFGLSLLAASVFSVLFGIYLIYSLVAKLHTHCPLCYLGHAINAALLILLLVLS